MSVRALDIKLYRELWQMRGQALAIALVVAAGVATFVLSRATIDSLQYTQDSFYRESRFAEVFAPLERAPDAVAARLRAVPGVAAVETRIVTPARLTVRGFDEPASALMVSLPDATQQLGRLYLRSGRLPVADDEVAVHEAFAEQHRLVPGDELGAIVEGRAKRLRIVGIALSAEFVYLIRPGDMLPDHQRFAVVWMPRRALAAAAGLDGAFDDAIATLSDPAVEPEVIAAFDRILEPYGSTGAYGRADQTSHHYLSGEIEQLEVQGDVIPLVFLSVAAFLLNVVVARLVAHQRETIGIIKAFGYGAPTIAWHYLAFMGAIVLVGAVLGTIAGARLGQGLASMYSEFFRYPYLRFRLDPSVALTASAIAVVAAFAGTLHAVWRAVRVPPAAAMHPPPPPQFRETLFERLGLKRFLSHLGRMILRSIARRPVRSALTALGVSFSAAIVTVGGFMEDSVGFMMDVQFRQAMVADGTVALTGTSDARALRGIERLPGVTAAEPFRTVPVRLRHGHLSYRTAIRGVPAAGRLYRLLDADQAQVRLPPAGLVLTDHLAGRLGVVPGDALLVEVMDGRRQRLELRVGATTREFTGMNAYMDLEALQRALGESRSLDGAFVEVERSARAALASATQERPRLLAATLTSSTIAQFEKFMAENILLFATVNIALASCISIGVIYNTMRIALAERTIELASLRVLGFTRGEVAYVLIGEIGALTLLAIPLGWALGHAFCAWIATALGSDLYRIPVVLLPSTYAQAATVVLIATVATAAVTFHRLGQLDLVAALKIKE